MIIIRLVLVAALISLCVFGVPEGCLVFTSLVSPGPYPMSTTEMSTPNAFQR